MAEKQLPPMDPALQRAMGQQAVASMLRLDVAKHLFGTLLTETLVNQGATPAQISGGSDQLAQLAWHLADGFINAGSIPAAELKARIGGQSGEPRPS